MAIDPTNEEQKHVTWGMILCEKGNVETEGNGRKWVSTSAILKKVAVAIYLPRVWIQVSMWKNMFGRQ